MRDTVEHTLLEIDADTVGRARVPLTVLLSEAQDEELCEGLLDMVTLTHDEVLVLAEEEGLALIEGDALAELLADGVPRMALSVADCDAEGVRVPGPVIDGREDTEGDLLVLVLTLPEGDELAEALACGDALPERLARGVGLVDTLAHCVALPESDALGDFDGFAEALALGD